MSEWDRERREMKGEGENKRERGRRKEGRRTQKVKERGAQEIENITKGLKLAVFLLRFHDLR